MDRLTCLTLYVAANYPINEVSLFFNNRLYRGNRTTKAHADGFDAFASKPATAAGSGYSYSSSGHAACADHLRRADRSPDHPQPIGVVTIYPGISADVVRNFLRQPVKALILRSYGGQRAAEQ